MKETSRNWPTGPSSWLTLLKVLAVPLAVSAVLLAVWLAHGRQRLDDSVLPALTSLGMMSSALWCLRSSSAEGLVLPTPIMIWPLLSAREPDAPLVALLVSHAACVTLLAACCYEKRGLARVAVVVCGVATTWLHWPR